MNQVQRNPLTGMIEAVPGPTNAPVAPAPVAPQAAGPNEGFIGFYRNPLGWLGHNVFGGAEQKDINATQNRLDEQFTNPVPNPYGAGNPGLMSLLASQQGAISRNYANAEQNMRRSLAQRGALGTAQETSGLRQLMLDRNRALSGNEADLTAGAYDKAAGYSADQRQSLLNYLMDRRGQYQQQQDAKLQGLGSLLQAGASIGGRYVGMR